MAENLYTYCGYYLWFGSNLSLQLVAVARSSGHLLAGPCTRSIFPGYAWMCMDMQHAKMHECRSIRTCLISLVFFGCFVCLVCVCFCDFAGNSILVPYASGFLRAASLLAWNCEFAFRSDSDIKNLKSLARNKTLRWDRHWPLHQLEPLLPVPEIFDPVIRAPHIPSSFQCL